MVKRPPADLAHALHREVAREVQRAHRAREGFLQSEDAESLHRLRVSLRRLRALGRLTRPYLRRPTGLTERVFRRVGALLAGIRDIDVALDALRAAATRSGTEEREVIGAALDRLLRARDREIGLTKRRLRARPATKAFEALTVWGERAGVTSLGTAPAERGAGALARGVSQRLLADRAWTRRFGSGKTDASLHRMRRRVRRARYQVEAVAAVLGREAPRSLAWLTEIQDALGRVQDVVAVAGTLRGSRRGRAALELESLERWSGRRGAEGRAEWDRLRAGRVAWKRVVERELGR